MLPVSIIGQVWRLPVTSGTEAASSCLLPSRGQHPADWCSWPTELPTTHLCSCLPSVFHYHHFHRCLPVLWVLLGQVPTQCSAETTAHTIDRRPTLLHLPFLPCITYRQVSKYIGPDLQNILRQSSYDKLRSTYDGRLIDKTSYEGRKAFAKYNLQNRKFVWDDVRTLAHDIP